MPISSNARSAADKKSFKALLAALPKDAKSGEIDIKYTRDGIRVTVEGEARDLSRDEYEGWEGAGFPWQNGPASPDFSKPEAAEPLPFNPQPKPSSKKKAAAKEPAPEPKPKPQKTRKHVEPEQADSIFEELAAQAIDISNEEHKGSINSNAARLRRGELMLRLAGVSKAAKIPMKTVLRDVNADAAALAANSGVTYAEITEQEASTTRKVVERFGSSGTFRLVNAVNPVTGDPLVGDNGKPLVRDLTEVAVNKLYTAADYVDESTDEAALDQLLSFLLRHGEKVVKAAKRVAKRNDIGIYSVIKDVDALRVTSNSPLTGKEVKIEADEATILGALREMAGEPEKEDIATIRTSRAWYEGTWRRVKGMVDAVAGAFIPQVVNETTGQTSNVFVLERTLTQLFDPIEDDNVHRLLGALVASGDLTDAQADEFINNFAVDTETGEWARTTSSITAKDEEDADLEDDGDGEDVLDGIDDIDLPEGTEEDDDSEEDDDF